MINFKQYPSMTKCIIPNSVTLTTTDFSSAFYSMHNLQEFSIPDSITNIMMICNNCTNLTTAVCGDNVTNMSSAYYNCTNLTTAVCGDNVKSMIYAYYGCTNLTTAVCGPNVTHMANTYENCTNLTTAVCGSNVTHIMGAYRNAVNIQGNAYIYSPKINYATGVFNGRNTSNMLNIYVPSNSTTLTCFQIRNEYSIISQYISWTNNISNDYFYNTQYNIYIYPVENVAAAREANGD